MNSARPFTPKLGYCMNVHAAQDFAATLANLQQFAGTIRSKLVANQVLESAERMGVGLWLSDAVVADLSQSHGVQRLKSTLEQLGLEAFTFNGFPQKNFHQPVVKHQVYLPTWWEPARRDYTIALSNIMSQLLEPGTVGSISTLPIAWSQPTPTNEQLQLAATHLKEVAVHLAHLKSTQQRDIVLAIEPEPGCLLGDCADLRRFFLRYLFNGLDVDIIRRHITVCHDVCHSAVMREDQAQQIQAYRDCGIRIGKVQVSSAVHIDWDLLDESQRVEAFEQVKSFAEDRYLHQTTVRTGPVGSIALVEDLYQLIERTQAAHQLTGSWNIHFHVPIHVASIGRLESTQYDIPEVISALENLPGTPVSNGKMAEPVTYRRPMNAKFAEEFFTGHFEIETYAWSVLPSQFRRQTITEDIAEEFAYLKPLLSAAPSQAATIST